jgi:hypothetical protein
MAYIARVYTYMVFGGGLAIGGLAGYWTKVAVERIRAPKVAKP